MRVALSAGDVSRPVDVVRLLAAHGLSLRKAHETMVRIAAGDTVFIELAASGEAEIASALARLGVSARRLRHPAADVRDVRRRLGLSQAEFAVRFGFEIDTVQNWEQGRNTPDQAVQLLLKVIERRPDVVEALLVEEVPAGA